MHGTGNLSKRSNNSSLVIKLSLGSGQGSGGLSEERVDTDYYIITWFMDFWFHNLLHTMCIIERKKLSSWSFSDDLKLTLLLHKSNLWSLSWWGVFLILLFLQQKKIILSPQCCIQVKAFRNVLFLRVVDLSRPHFQLIKRYIFHVHTINMFLN